MIFGGDEPEVVDDVRSLVVVVLEELNIGPKPVDATACRALPFDVELMLGLRSSDRPCYSRVQGRAHTEDLRAPEVSATTDLSDSLPVTVEITVFADEDSFFKTEWAYMEIGPDVEISTDEFLPSVTGTLTNPTDQTVDFFPINCLLVDADDNVVTAVSGFGDSTAPGQTIAFELTGEVETAVNAGAVSTECISIASLD